MIIQAVKPRIAVIGAGISGLGAAYALKDTAEISLFEKRDRPGGHANTVEIDYDGTPIRVDTGFIVFNHLTYPNFCPLLDELGVASHESDMSFSFALQGGVEWSSNREGLFAQKRNFVNMRHLKMLRDILRFNSLAQKELAEDRLGARSLGEWLAANGFDRTFQHRYILPMGAAIWSSSDAEISEVSAASFIRFFRNHRLMHAKRPKWRTVTGGSHSYVRAILDAIGEERVQYSAQISQIERVDGGVALRHGDGSIRHFDHVIMALHADDALGMVQGLSDHERHLLEAFPYSRNKVYLHRDASLMPKRRKAWAAWNAMAVEEGGAAAVSYWMNTLQGIDQDKPLFVTLNAHRAPNRALTFGEYDYNHPQFSPSSDEAQARFANIQGRGGLWFAGAWLGYGFHEDGLRSGLQVARALGGRVGFDIADSDAPYNLGPAPQSVASATNEAISA
jgi:predicted NAD/FAD-binding protein